MRRDTLVHLLSYFLAHAAGVDVFLSIQDQVSLIRQSRIACPYYCDGCGKGPFSAKNSLYTSGIPAF